MLKNRIRKNFSKLPNAIIEDKNLSINAKALFWYLASRPEYWIINNKTIQETLNIKDPKTLSKYIKELINSGWISRGKIKDINGKLTGNYDYIINEVAYAKDEDSNNYIQDVLNTSSDANSSSIQELAITKTSTQKIQAKDKLSQSSTQDDFNTSPESPKFGVSDKDYRITKFSILGKIGGYNNKEFINKKKYIKKNKKNKQKKQKKDFSHSKSSQSISKSKENTKSEILALALPENVGREMWGEFVAFRNDISKPLTPRGAKMALQKLSSFEFL